MKFNLKGAVPVLCSAALLGCAQTDVLIKPEVMDRVQSTRVHLLIPQEEINFYVASAGVAQAGGGGLALALIDASIEKNRAEEANRMIDPLRKKLTDIDVRSELDKKLRTALTNIPALKVDKVEVVAKPQDGLEALYRKPMGNVEFEGLIVEGIKAKKRADALQVMRKEISQDSLLLISIDYIMSPGYRSLIVNGSSALWQRGQDKVQYVGNYRYISAPIGPAEGEAAVKDWAANQGNHLRTALLEGIHEMARMISIDFNAKPSKEQAAGSIGDTGELSVVSVQFPIGFRKGGVEFIKLGSVATEVLAKNDDRLIYRSKAVGLHTVTGQILSATTRQRMETSSVSMLTEQPVSPGK